MAEPEYPEHEKLHALEGASQTVGEFMEWLKQQGISLWQEGEVLVEWRANPVDGLMRVTKTTEDLLAEFYEIDRQALEREKEQMLADIRQLQNLG